MRNKVAFIWETINLGAMGGQLMVIAWLLFGLIIFLVMMWFFMQLSLYNTKVMIKDRQRWRFEKAKRVRKGQVITYEFLSSFFRRKAEKERFAVEHRHIQQTKGGNLIILFQLSYGAYWPYENQQPSDVPDAPVKVPSWYMQNNTDKITGFQSYAPYNVNQEVVGDLTPIKQDSLKWLADSNKEIDAKYDAPKWWQNPTVIGSAVLLITAVICLIMVSSTTDSIANLGGVCQAAERGITQNVIQKIT